MYLRRYFTRRKSPIKNVGASFRRRHGFDPRVIRDQGGRTIARYTPGVEQGGYEMAKHTQSAKPSELSKPASARDRPATSIISTFAETELVDQIGHWHQIATGFANDTQTNAARAITAARNCGQYLLAAKEQVGHGKWEDWLRTNVPFSQWTACKYIRLFSSTKRGADLSASQSLRQAYQLLGIIEPSKLTGIKSNETDIIQPIISIEVVLGLPWRRWKQEVFDAYKDKADLSRIQRWREYTKPIREVDEWCEKVEQQLMGVNK